MVHDNGRGGASGKLARDRRTSALPDPAGPAALLPEAAGHYRAHLQRHPDDESAWEGLAAVHRRLADGEGQPAPPELRAAHLRLAFECERRALELCPHSLRLRHRLLTTLAAALGEAPRGQADGPLGGVILALGGVQATGREALRVVDETLAHYGNAPREQGGWLCDGLPTWRSRLLARQEAPTGTVEEGADAPQSQAALLNRHLAAMNGGDLRAAGLELDALEIIWDTEDAVRLARGEPPLHHGRPRVYRLLLLEAQDRHAGARALARQEADALGALLDRHPSDRPRLDRAALLEYAGDQQAAVALLNELAGRPGEQQQTALKELARIQSGKPLHL